MKKMRGFSLVELLVVMAIMAALVGILLPQFTSFSRDQVLQSEAAKLQTTLRAAQNNAASGLKCDPAYPAQSWGIKFLDRDTYQLETTCNNPTASPTPTAFSTKSYPLAPTVEIDYIDIDNVRTPDNLSGGGDPIAAYQMGVTFSNISAAVSFQGPINAGFNYDYPQMTIVLRQKADNSKTISIIVERGGSIYVSSN